MNKKILRIFISIILAGSMTVSFATTCAASAIHTTEDADALFDALPDDAIVCYMLGQPVYKYEVDENRRVHKDFSSSIEPFVMGEDDTLPSMHWNEMIIALIQVTAIGYSQVEYIMYIPPEEGEAMVDALGYDEVYDIYIAIDRIMSVVQSAPASFLSALTAAVRFLMALQPIMFESLINDVEDYSSDDENCMLILTSNAYGSFYALEPWDGRSCVRYPSDLSTGTVSIDVECPHGSPWE